MYDPNARSFHPGSFVRFVLGKQFDLGARNETGVVISTGEKLTHWGNMTQTVVIQYRLDVIGADGRIEKFAGDVFPMNYNPATGLCTGRQPNSNVIHIQNRYNTYCGSGDNTIGTRRRFHGIIENKPVTCKKCLKAMEQDPELARRVTAQLVYANTGKFWQALGELLNKEAVR